MKIIILTDFEKCMTLDVINNCPLTNLLDSYMILLKFDTN